MEFGLVMLTGFTYWRVLACKFWYAFSSSLRLSHLGDKISEREKEDDEVKVNCREVEV